MANVTTEIFIREHRESDTCLWEDVFRRQGTQEVMTRSEFNEYYKANENKYNHIVII